MKAQLFSSDLIVALFIFLILIGTISVVYSQVLDSHSRDLQRKSLELEGMKFLGNFLRTKGLPENWEDLTASEYVGDSNKWQLGLNQESYAPRFHALKQHLRLIQSKHYLLDTSLIFSLIRN